MVRTPNPGVIGQGRSQLPTKKDPPINPEKFSSMMKQPSWRRSADDDKENTVQKVLDYRQTASTPYDLRASNSLSESTGYSIEQDRSNDGKSTLAVVSSSTAIPGLSSCGRPSRVVALQPVTSTTPPYSCQARELEGRMVQLETFQVYTTRRAAEEKKKQILERQRHFKEQVQQTLKQAQSPRSAIPLPSPKKAHPIQDLNASSEPLTIEDEAFQRLLRKLTGGGSSESSTQQRPIGTTRQDQSRSSRRSDSGYGSMDSDQSNNSQYSSQYPGSVHQNKPPAVVEKSDIKFNPRARDFFTLGDVKTSLPHSAFVEPTLTRSTQSVATQTETQRPLFPNASVQPTSSISTDITTGMPPFVFQGPPALNPQPGMPPLPPVLPSDSLLWGRVGAFPYPVLPPWSLGPYTGASGGLPGLPPFLARADPWALTSRMHMPLLASQPPTSFQRPAAPGRLVPKPKAPDAEGQLAYEEQIERRKAADPSYARECKERQMRRFRKQQNMSKLNDKPMTRAPETAEPVSPGIA